MLHDFIVRHKSTFSDLMEIYVEIFSTSTEFFSKSAYSDKPVFSSLRYQYQFQGCVIKIPNFSSLKYRYQFQGCQLLVLWMSVISSKYLRGIFFLSENPHIPLYSCKYQVQHRKTFKTIVSNVFVERHAPYTQNTSFADFVRIDAL